jgi:hypothetical protein
MSDQPFLKLGLNFGSPCKRLVVSKIGIEFQSPYKQSPQSKNVTKIFHLFQVMIGFIQGMQPNFIDPRNDHPYQKMQLKLSTPILVVIGPFPKSATKFELSQQMIAPIQEYDPNCPPMSKYRSALSKECD